MLACVSPVSWATFLISTPPSGLTINVTRWLTIHLYQNRVPGMPDRCFFAQRNTTDICPSGPVTGSVTSCSQHFAVQSCATWLLRRSALPPPACTCAEVPRLCGQVMLPGIAVAKSVGWLSLGHPHAQPVTVWLILCKFICSSIIVIRVMLY